MVSKEQANTGSGENQLMISIHLPVSINRFLFQHPLSFQAIMSTINLLP